jgi:hypothetical protein
LAKDHTKSFFASWTSKKATWMKPLKWWFK